MPTTVPDIPLSQIRGYAEVAHIVADRPLHQFGGVVSILYRRQIENSHGGVWPSIELVMQEQVAPHRQIGFRFHGVRDVRFSGWGGIVGLYFQSIKDRGWEDARFEVGDYEQSCIHLFCYEISVFDPERIAEQIASHEPPLPVSDTITPVCRTLDSLPAPGSSGGR